MLESERVEELLLEEPSKFGDEENHQDRDQNQPGVCVRLEHNIVLEIFCSCSRILCRDGLALVSGMIL